MTYKKLYKYTSIDHLQDDIEFGVHVCLLSNLNDPYERNGIRYPDSIGVCSLTKSNLKMLMWSYYTCHRGCCIEYVFDDEVGALLTPVTYVKRLVRRQSMDQDRLIQSLYTKGYEWKHENEVRLVYREDDESDIWIQGKGEVYLRGKVNRIFFGALIEENEGYNDALLKINKYNKLNTKQIEVKKVVLSDEKYKLIVDPHYDYIKELWK